MKLIILQVVLLVFGSLFLIMGAGEQKQFNRASALVTGITLYIILFVTMRGGV